LTKSALENTCFSTVLPKIFGGLDANTFFEAVDTDTDGNFVVGGRSEDLTIVNSPSPIIVYISRHSYYKWAKQLASGYDYVSALKIKPDGSRIIASLNKAPLLLLLIDAQDGTLINSFEESGSTFNEIVNGGLLFSSDDFVYMATERTDLTAEITKIRAETAGPVTSLFSRQRPETNAKTYTLIFGRT